MTVGKGRSECTIKGGRVTGWSITDCYLTAVRLRMAEGSLRRPLLAAVELRDCDSPKLRWDATPQHEEPGRLYPGMRP